MRQSEKCDGLFFPNLRTAQILHPSNHHLFGPVKNAPHGRHFADDNELKQSFCDVLQSQSNEF
jgi:hypothetical protein